MSNSLRDPAQDHIDAIYRMIDYLLETCADRFDSEMERHTQTLLRSFEDFREGKPIYRFPRDRLMDDSLGRNYLTAQCTVLMVFAKTVEDLIQRQGTNLLQKTLDELWSELNRKYVMFFGERPSEAGSV